MFVEFRIMSDNNSNLSERSSMDDMDLISDEEHDHIRHRKRSSSHLERTGEPSAKIEKKRNDARLVSYDDDDDDFANTTHEIEDEVAIREVKDEEESHSNEIVQKKPKEAEDHEVTSKDCAIEYPYMGYNVELPPEPSGKCPKRIQDRVTELYNKMVREGKNMNQSIRATKKFRNPVIYEKLLEFLDIDEKGTNYPTELYNPAIWGPHSHYEELAKAQWSEMEKREKEKKDGKKDKPTVDKIQATKKSKTKWDDPTANNSNGQQKVSKS